MVLINYFRKLYSYVTGSNAILNSMNTRFDILPAKLDAQANAMNSLESSIESINAAGQARLDTLQTSLVSISAYFEAVAAPAINLKKFAFLVHDPMMLVHYGDVWKALGSSNFTIVLTEYFASDEKGNERLGLSDFLSRVHAEGYEVRQIKEIINCGIKFEYVVTNHVISGSTEDVKPESAEDHFKKLLNRGLLLEGQEPVWEFAVDIDTYLPLQIGKKQIRYMYGSDISDGWSLSNWNSIYDIFLCHGVKDEEAIKELFHGKTYIMGYPTYIQFFSEIMNPNIVNIDLEESQQRKPSGSVNAMSESEENGAVSISLLPNEALRVVFIVQHPSLLSSWYSVWLAANIDPRFHAKVVLAPFIHQFSSGAVTYDDMKHSLISKNIPFCTAEYFDVNAFRPHVTFIHNPYEETRPENLRLNNLKKAGTKIAYIPYGLEIGGGAWNIAAQFDSTIHRYAWRIFARSERHKTMFGKYCRAGNDHVHVTGHPKFDLRNSLPNAASNAEFIQKIGGRRVILWTPHFSVGDPPTWSTYMLYGESIISELKRRNDLFLLIRPHPMFFNAMRQHNVWDTKSEQDFRQAIFDSDNLALDETSDYHDAFSVSNALMTDVGSFLLEYLPTGKPLLYLHCPGGLGMNDDGDLTRHLYAAFSQSDILSFIDMVACGEDPLNDERKSVLQEYLFGLDSNVGERICQHVYSSISAGAHSHLVFSDHCSIGQAQSKEYWKGASNTYLAPQDYYDAKEIILNDVLTRLPRFNNAIDIGCGDGRFTCLLAKHTNEIIGYDISPTLVEKAKEAAATGNIGNVQFVTQELEMLTPFEKYDLITCMGVTSCIIDDTKFLHILDKFRMLSKQGGHLILIDSLSSDQDQIISDQSGYIAKYRAISDYRSMVTRRGYRLKEEFLIKDVIEKKLINKIFIFEFIDMYAPRQSQFHETN